MYYESTDCTNEEECLEYGQIDPVHAYGHQSAVSSLLGRSASSSTKKRERMGGSSAPSGVEDASACRLA